MSLAQWSLAVGLLLVAMALVGTLLGRLPLSSATVYLALGWLPVRAWRTCCSRIRCSMSWYWNGWPKSPC